MLTILRRRREAEMHKINPKLLELQAAKEILGEIFHARPAEIDDMIQGRLAERSWPAEQPSSPDEGLWPATFCLCE